MSVDVSWAEAVAAETRLATAAGLPGDGRCLAARCYREVADEARQRREAIRQLAGLRREDW